MNNKEAFNLLCSQPSIRAVSDRFIRYFQVIRTASEELIRSFELHDSEHMFHK